MSVSNILNTAKSSGIGLFVRDDKLRIEAPKGRLTPELRDEISQHKVEIIRELTAKPTCPAPRMTPDVAHQLAVDSETLFIHFSRRLYDRLSRVMCLGYLAWTQTHEPELWARREAARIAWDTPEAYQAFKDCQTPWPEYRRLVHSWARLEIEAIRRHRYSVCISGMLYPQMGTRVEKDIPFDLAINNRTYLEA